MTPAHALRVSGEAKNQPDDVINARIEDFYTQLRAADETTARKMIDDPTGWDK